MLSPLCPFIEKSMHIGILNGTCFFPTVQLQVHKENPVRDGRNIDALLNQTKLCNSHLVFHLLIDRNFYTTKKSVVN